MSRLLVNVFNTVKKNLVKQLVMTLLFILLLSVNYYLVKSDWEERIVILIEKSDIPEKTCKFIPRLYFSRSSR